MKAGLRPIAMVLWAGVLAVAAVAPVTAQEKKQQGGKATVGKAVKRVQDAHKTAAGVQDEVESLSDKALDLTAQYRNTQRRIASLKVYNDQLQGLVDNQEKEIGEVRSQIDEVGVVGRQILPLLQRMIDTLAEFVKLDTPFLVEERNLRVRHLRELMARADVSNAEKYRRVLEAYQIENEYGRTIEAYKAALPGDESDRSVEFLRVGRVALIYRSLDGKEFGVWDIKAQDFVPVDSRYERDIMAGLRIAREQAAPDLIRVPVPAPTPAGEEQ